MPAQPDRQGGAASAGAAGAGPAGRTPDGHAPVRLTAWVEGRVQGVGFRWWVRSHARRLGLTGTATNLADGQVRVIAEGGRAACHELLDLLRGPDTPGQVTAVSPEWDQARGEFAAFTAV
jgi:acylphosphatase